MMGEFEDLKFKLFFVYDMTICYLRYLLLAYSIIPLILPPLLNRLFQSFPHIEFSTNNFNCFKNSMKKTIFSIFNLGQRFNEIHLAAHKNRISFENIGKLLFNVLLSGYYKWLWYFFLSDILITWKFICFSTVSKKFKFKFN